MNKWGIGGAIAIFMLLIAACIVAVLKIDIAPEKKQSKAAARTRNFGENIKISKHGLYGVDLISIGKAHMRKLRKGPFTIGAINELVLENVSLALPEELWNPPSQPSQPTTNYQPTNYQPTNYQQTKHQLSKLGIDTGSLKLGGKIPRFSALRINNLSVSRLTSQPTTNYQPTNYQPTNYQPTNYQPTNYHPSPWFFASRAKGERAGLALYNGWSVENGRTNAWKEAFLVVEPRLKLYVP